MTYVYTEEVTKAACAEYPAVQDRVTRVELLVTSNPSPRRSSMLSSEQAAQLN